MRIRTTAAATLAVLSTLCVPAAATAALLESQVCSWSSGFSAIGFDQPLLSGIAYDDGSGSKLCVGGGRFRFIDGEPARGVVCFDGTNWTQLGTAIDFVQDLLVFNGTLIAASSGIAAWDGSAWTPSSTGINTLNGNASALAVYDDGGGPALYAAGLFTTAGGVTVNRIAKWDGSSWSALGTGLNSLALTLGVYDDGTGAKLYVGGGFSSAGGVPAANIAAWDGSNWSALGAGTNSTVRALEVYDDGGGPALYVGGSFSQAGGLSAGGLARWDGTSWSTTGASGLQVHALQTFDDGTGSRLFVSSDALSPFFVRRAKLERFDGTTFTPAGTPDDIVLDFAIWDDGTGPALWAAGQVTAIDGMVVGHLARWNGTTWLSPFGATGNGLDAFVRALGLFDDGSGLALYAAGDFQVAGNLPAERIARWNGSSWANLGDFDNSVWDLLAFDDGTGPALYAGGFFRSVNGTAANGLAKWDGASWTALDAGFVQALAAFDDGSGTALYAGGPLPIIGGVGSRIAKLQSGAWSAVGTGLNGTINDLAVFDDGSGPALYATGQFTATSGAPSTAVSRIAKWDGTAWSALGSGLSSTGSHLEVFDDGSGPALYVTGDFSTAGGISTGRIARWNGTTWSALSPGFFAFRPAIGVADDGRGAALFVGTPSVSRWTGSAFDTLGQGLANSSSGALLGFDDGSGPALFVGGSIADAAGTPSTNIARWSCHSTQITTTPASLVEGDAGSAPLRLPVALAEASDNPVVFDLTLIHGTTSAADVALAAPQLVVPAGAFTANVTVDVLGDLAIEGDEAFTVELHEPANGALLATVSGTVRDNDGVVAEPEITVSPASVQLPGGIVGQTTSQTVTIANIGLADLVLGPLGGLAPPFGPAADGCSGTTLTPSASCTVLVTFTPTTLGPAAATLSIPSNDPAQPTVSVPVTGTATGAGIPTTGAFGLVVLAALLGGAALVRIRR